MAELRRILPGRGRRRPMLLTAAAIAAGLIVVPAAVAGAASPGPGTASPGPGTASPGPGASKADCPWATSTAPVAQRVAQLMSHMTLTDKIGMVEGHGITNPYVFYTGAIPALCVPALGLEDGPAGVADMMTGVTQLPAGVAVAATWDPGLARRYGTVIGAEEYGKGASADLGPTVNIDRDPRWGRSFEALSEDPYLNSQLDVGEIDGVQSQDVMSQVKHFDAYNQETYRNTPADNVVVSDRALHEIYMPSFEAAVTQAGAASVMCAYSWVNGTDSCNNSYLLTDTLDELWGFPGFVTSDYGALQSTQGAVEGDDMEQPSSTYYGTALRDDVEDGTIPLSALNTMVQRILTEMFRFNLFGRPRADSTSDTVTTPAHVAVATQVAEAATTLLKNDGRTLPLDGSGSVAVIGPAASASPAYAGGGSSYVIGSSPVSPLAGIQEQDPDATYAQGLPTDTSLPAIPSADLSPAYAPTGFGGSYTGRLTAPRTGTYVLALTNPCECYTSTYLTLDGTRLLDDPGTPPVSTYSVAVNLTAGKTYTLAISGDSSRLLWGTPATLAPGIAAAVAAAKSASTAVVVVSDDTESEATDRPSLNLPSAQNELIEAVAAANPRTVVVINAGAPVAMPWLNQVSAVLDAWYPGQVSGTALASVLFGQTDPGGHLPVTFPVSLSQVPASATAGFPGNGTEVRYSEGIDVGYRWYEVKDETPLFPFGFGLSYTAFAFSGLRLGTVTTDGTQDVHVSATITNTGPVSGSDVAQLYLGDPAASGEPPRQLEGFQRVTLAPGQSAPVNFTIAPADMSWWSDGADGWTQTPGHYDVYVGDSSALTSLPLRGAFTMTTTPGARQVSVSAPSVMHPGQAAVVRVTLSADGDATLRDVRVQLQLPQGWTAIPVGPAAFGLVRPGQAPAVTFQVIPPGYAPNASAVVHATVTVGDWQREAGVTVTVS